MSDESRSTRTLNWVISWRGLQWASVLTYSALALGLLYYGVCRGQWSPVLLVTVFSLLAMIARLSWAKSKGLCGDKYSHSVRKKHLTLWAPAFLPERTAVVPVILVLYLSIMKPEVEGVVSAIFGLLVTGGLIAAVITSPHTLVQLVDDLDEAQRKENGWR